MIFWVDRAFFFGIMHALNIIIPAGVDHQLFGKAVGSAISIQVFVGLVGRPGVAGVQSAHNHYLGKAALFHTGHTFGQPADGHSVAVHGELQRADVISPLVRAPVAVVP